VKAKHPPKMADKAAKAGLVALGAGLAFLAKHFIDESATEPTQPTVVKEKRRRQQEQKSKVDEIHSKVVETPPTPTVKEPVKTPSIPTSKKKTDDDIDDAFPVVAVAAGACAIVLGVCKMIFKRKSTTPKRQLQPPKKTEEKSVVDQTPSAKKTPTTNAKKTSTPIHSPRRDTTGHDGTHTKGGLAEATLEAHGIRVSVSPFGATLTRIEVAGNDDDDAFEDVVLGYEDVESYDGTEGRPYFGAVCGRVANRIAGGEFKIGRETYACAKNNGENTLHGGVSGWDRKRWTVVDKTKTSITLCYESPAMEEGFPGKVKMYVIYSLVGFDERVELVPDEKRGEVKLRVRKYAELTTRMTATTDAQTPVSTVQHTYFNLKGHACGEDCRSHTIELPRSEFYVPVDPETLIPTGAGLKTVKGTPFDLRTETPMFAKCEEGYDNTFVVAGDDATRPVRDLPYKEPRLAARVKCAEAGRMLEVFTDAPGVHLYTGNFLSETMIGRLKDGATYVPQGGFCLETGWFPDAVNQHEKVGASYPSVMLRRGDTYSHTLTYRFSPL
jgi:aldose 1-epimerase